jgi:hypothetical protein
VRWLRLDAHRPAGASYRSTLPSTTLPLLWRPSVDDWTCLGLGSICRMTDEMRAALRLIVESHPAGSTVGVLREHLLDLLEPSTHGVTVSAPPAAVDLTCRQVADALGRDGSTIRAWAARGDFPGAYRLNGREWRIPPESLRAWQDAQRNGPPGPAPQVARGRPGLRLSSWRSMPAKAR